MEKMLTKQQVAEALHVPPHTLSFWRAKGRGPQGVKIGKHVMYPESEVERWLTEKIQEQA